MKPKRRLLLGLLLTSLIAGSALYLLALREPSYQDRNLSEWLTELDGYVHASKALKAEAAVRHMGSPCVPHLLAMLENRDSDLKKKLLRLLRKQPVAALAPLSEYRHHARARNALRALGTNAAPAIPVLVTWIESKEQTPAAQKKRALAFAILGRELAPLAQGAIPALLRSLSDPDPNTRTSAAYALGHIGGQPSLVIPPLIRCLNDPVATVRGNTMFALGQYGPDAKAAVPALEQALNEVNVNNQHLALSALHKIEPARQAGTPQWQAIQKTIP
jgi:HEAT repeat protein